MDLRQEMMEHMRSDLFSFLLSGSTRHRLQCYDNDGNCIVIM
jgi:hypothetical protein